MFHVVCCIKQVPDPRYYSKIRLDPSTGTMIREGVPLVINLVDKCVIEQALVLRETAGGGAVTALTMGPPQAEDTLRECLAMGADRGDPAH